MLFLWLPAGLLGVVGRLGFELAFGLFTRVEVTRDRHAAFAKQRIGFSDSSLTFYCYL